MIQNVNDHVREYGRRHRFHSRWMKLLCAMACVVVFCTTYALILPAITLDSSATCGMEEHTHGDSCYERALSCGLEEGEGAHTHGEDCYDEEGSLTCTLEESNGHVHTDDCYEQVLTCSLPEHTHSESCYPQEDEPAGTEDQPEAGTEGETEPAPEEQPEAGTDADAEQETDPLTEEETEALTLTEQTVTADVYTDGAYTSPYTEPVTVTLKGLLPEGVTVKAYPVNVTLDDPAATVVEAYDIGLFVKTADGEEKEYEPEQKVEVTITSDKLKEIASVNVYHIDDADDANPDPQPELVTDGVAVDEGNAVKFDAEKFSTYVLADANSDDGIAPAAVSGNTITLADGTTKAAIYYLQSPTGDPITNDTNVWSPAAGTSTLLATINVDESANYWADSTDGQHPRKNIVENPENYIVSWPDGSPGASWTVQSGSDNFNDILNSIWNNYKASIEAELQVTNLQTSDITSITLSPAKISRQNAGSGDQYFHIDCRISVTSTKVYTAKFWVLEPGSSTYSQVAAKNYKTSDTVENAEDKDYYYYDRKVGQEKTVDGRTYVLTGWYTENSSGGARSDTKANFKKYTPSEAELKDGAVNFYAEWVEQANDLTIVKYAAGDENKLLPGAKFQLTNTSDSNKTYTVTTGDDGTATIRNIPYGTYTLSEIAAPTNYQAISNITVTVGDTVTISDTNTTGAEMKYDKLYIPNELATVDVTIAKVDSSKKALTGAEFYLYYEDSDTRYYYSENGWTTESEGKATVKPSGENATAVVSGLTIGKSYYLVETKAPDGYNLLTDKIIITPTAATALTVGGTGASANGLTVTVVNQTGEALPNTGGMGTTMYTAGGLAMMAIATLGCLMYSGRKRGKGSEQ